MSDMIGLFIGVVLGTVIGFLTAVYLSGGDKE